MNREREKKNYKTNREQQQGFNILFRIVLFLKERLNQDYLEKMSKNKKKKISIDIMITKKIKKNFV